MNKIPLAVILSTVLVFGAVVPALALTSWQGPLENWDVADKNKNTKTLSLTASDVVPKHTTELAGFAWLYDGFNPEDTEVDAVGITIHDADLNGDGKNDVIDSLQKKSGWHLHNFILAPPADVEGASVDLCVATIVDAPTAGISIQGADVKVNVKNSALLDDLAIGAVAFAIVVDPIGCAATVPTGDLVDQEILDELGVSDGLPLGIVLG
jgi:hypothetical protein